MLQIVQIHLWDGTLACPPPVDGYESGLKLALSSTVTWQVHGVILSLIDAEGEIVARFRAVYLQ